MGAEGVQPNTDLTWLTIGLDCASRLFISDRAHLVFGFHQVVDGLKEIELGGSSIGTTRRGIGPAYSSKASRSGMRVHHLYDKEKFAEKFRKLVEGRFKRYGTFEYDTEGEILKYQVSFAFLFEGYPVKTGDVIPIHIEAQSHSHSLNPLTGLR